MYIQHPSQLPAGGTGLQPYRTLGKEVKHTWGSSPFFTTAGALQMVPKQKIKTKIQPQQP